MKRGLLVDDDPIYLGVLQRSLERKGFQIQSCRSGATAIEAAQADPPDFALIDLKLDGESGLDLIAPLRQVCQGTHIVLITGYASVATAVEAMKRGADDYLVKPVSVATIVRVLQGESLLDEDAQPAMTPLNRVEWEHIQQAMIDTDGNVSAAARLLGMHRRSLQRKLAKRPSPQRSADS